VGARVHLERRAARRELHPRSVARQPVHQRRATLPGRHGRRHQHLPRRAGGEDALLARATHGARGRQRPGSVGRRQLVGDADVRDHPARRLGHQAGRQRPRLSLAGPVRMEPGARRRPFPRRGAALRLVPVEPRCPTSRVVRGAAGGHRQGVLLPRRSRRRALPVAGARRRAGAAREWPRRGGNGGRLHLPPRHRRHRAGAALAARRLRRRRAAEAPFPGRTGGDPVQDRRREVGSLAGRPAVPGISTPRTSASSSLRPTRPATRSRRPSIPPPTGSSATTRGSTGTPRRWGRRASPATRLPSTLPPTSRVCRMSCCNRPCPSSFHPPTARSSRAPTTSTSCGSRASRTTPSPATRCTREGAAAGRW
jgi:hypothetical protein